MGRTETTRVALAAILIGAGVILLALRLIGGVGGFVWPFFVIAPGVVLLALAASTGWRERTVAAAGGVVTGVGVILFVQNLTDYYQSWAYAWTLLPLFAGAALYLVADAGDDESARKIRRQLVLWSAVSFVVLGAIFETLIFHDRLLEGGIILPLLLIVAGGALLLRRGGPTRGVSRQDAQPPGGPDT